MAEEDRCPPTGSWGGRVVMELGEVPPEGERGVLEVEGVPLDASPELVVLYFESRRRSGGGPVRDWQRLGTLLFLTFEEPRDAQNVLARGSHRLGRAELQVRPAPPWDPWRLLLEGPDPRPLPALLETLLGRPTGSFELSRDPAPGWGMLHLQDPLTPAELATVQAWATGLCPGLRVLLAPQSPSVLVSTRGLPLDPDLLELYLENRRSGGGSVSSLRAIPAGTGAIVTFHELPAAQRVLQRHHQLQGVALSVSPYYSFLEPESGSASVSGENLVPGDAQMPDETPVPDKTLVPAAPSVPAENPVQGDTQVSGNTLVPGETPVPVVAMLLDPDLVPNASLKPAVLQPMPEELPAVHPKGHKAMPGWWHPLGGMQVQDEVVVPAEAGAVRFLQQHYQELLVSIPEVTLVPIEGDDVSGYRVSGEPQRCQAAVEFLNSLLGTVSSHPVPLHFPGITRFLRDQGGQSVLCQLEGDFQCIIELDGTQWNPPDPQELVELLPPGWHQELPFAAPRSWDDASDANDAKDGDGTSLHSSIEEIRELLAALCHDDATGDADKHPNVQWDHYGEPEMLPAGTREQEQEEGEEEAQLALALQRSMESSWHEQEQLARATELSLRSYHHEQQAVPTEEGQRDDELGLLAALEASLAEWLSLAHVAQVTVFSSFEQDVAAVPTALQQALEGHLRTERVQSEWLRAPTDTLRRALTLLQCQHAVSISLEDGTATLRGFNGYPASAARHLIHLLQCPPQPSTVAVGTAGTTACWVRWEPSGTAVPYGTNATVQLEQAWQCQACHLDLLLDGCPVTIDLARMEEYDLGSACTMPISRSQPPTQSARLLLVPEMPGMDEEVKLVPLAKGSEEFADTLHHFCETLEDQRGTIAVTKVQKLLHPLLYQQYWLKKSCMERGMAGTPGTANVPVERILFHGTSEASSREICLHGFNRSFCGRNATLYGHGVYFAARASLSVQDRYSPPGTDGTKFIFVAKVLTGQFAKGHPGLRAPPLCQAGGSDGGADARHPPLRYDSAVDDPQCPGIFVIFNDTQAYPQYLISCRWCPP